MVSEGKRSVNRIKNISLPHVNIVITIVLIEKESDNESSSSDDDRRGSDNEESEGETVDDYLFRRTKELNEHTREHPNDIAGWIKFIQFQVIILLSE